MIDIKTEVTKYPLYKLVMCSTGTSVVLSKVYYNWGNYYNGYLRVLRNKNCSMLFLTVLNNRKRDSKIIFY